MRMAHALPSFSCVRTIFLTCFFIPEKYELKMQPNDQPKKQERNEVMNKKNYVFFPSFNWPL